MGLYLRGKVLDVGCDEGHLRGLVPGLDYTGIDVGGSPDVLVDLEAAERLPFPDRAFDTVVCSDVLEHLDSLHRVFGEMVRVSRRWLVISLPNNWTNARRPIERGAGSFAFYGLPADKPVDRHKWFFSLEDAPGALASAFCEARLRCFPAEARSLTASRCTDIFEHAVRAGGFDQTIEAVEDGKATYDAAEAGRCVDALANRAIDALLA